MVDRNPQVMDVVEEALREDPDVSNAELQDRAAEIDPRIGELSPRSFNARYPLQVKRRLSNEDSGETDSGSNEERGTREKIRDSLLGFARDVAGAEDRGQVIDSYRSLERRVDEVMDAL